MKLTDKCKEDFTKWISKNHNEEIIHREGGDWGHGYEIDLSVDDILDELPESIQNSLIIDFFDSLEIYIGLVRFSVGGGYFEWRVHYTLYFGQELTRTEAMNSAIEKANELYNEKHK